MQMARRNNAKGTPTNRGRLYSDLGRVERTVAGAKALLGIFLTKLRNRLRHLTGDPKAWRYVTDNSVRFNDDLNQFQVYNEMFGMWFTLREQAMTVDQRIKALLTKAK